MNQAIPCFSTSPGIALTSHTLNYWWQQIKITHPSLVCGSEIVITCPMEWIDTGSISHAKTMTIDSVRLENPATGFIWMDVSDNGAL